ncbi:MAG: hypothetical protein ACFFCQ_02945, partial [Promethearchaeota archaeon]
MLKAKMLLLLIGGMIFLFIFLNFIPTSPTSPIEDINHISEKNSPIKNDSFQTQNQARAPQQTEEKMIVNAISNTDYYLGETITITGRIGLNVSGTFYGYGNKFVYAYWNSTTSEFAQRLKTDIGGEYWSTDGANLDQSGGYFTVSFNLNRDGTAFSRIKNQGSGLKLGLVDITIAIFSYNTPGTNTGFNTVKSYNETTVTFNVWGKGKISTTSVSPNPIIKTQNGTFEVRTHDLQKGTIAIGNVPIQIVSQDPGNYTVHMSGGITGVDGTLVFEIETANDTNPGTYSIDFQANFTNNASDFYVGEDYNPPGATANTSVITVSFNVIDSAWITASVTATTHLGLPGIVSPNQKSAFEPNPNTYFEVFPGYTTITIEGDYRNTVGELITTEDYEIQAYLELNGGGGGKTAIGSPTNVSNGVYSTQVFVPNTINAVLFGEDVAVYVNFTGYNGNYDPQGATNDTIRLVSLTQITDLTAQSETGVSSTSNNTIFIYEGEDVTLMGALQDDYGNNLALKNLVPSSDDPGVSTLPFSTTSASSGDNFNKPFTLGDGSTRQTVTITLTFEDEAHYRNISKAIRVLVYNESITFQNLEVEWELDDQMNVISLDSISLWNSTSQSTINNNTIISDTNITTVRVLETLTVRDNWNRPLTIRPQPIQIRFQPQSAVPSFQTYVNPPADNVTADDGNIENWTTDWPLDAILVIRVVSAGGMEISRVQLTIQINIVYDVHTPTINFQELSWYNTMSDEYEILPSVDAQIVNGTIKFSIQIDDNDTQAISSTSAQTIEISLIASGRPIVYPIINSTQYRGQYQELATYNFTLNTTGSINDVYTINITVWDNFDNTATTTAQTITIANSDTIKPQLEVLSIAYQNPNETPILTGTQVSISIRANDSDGFDNRTQLAGIKDIGGVLVRIDDSSAIPASLINPVTGLYYVELNSLDFGKDEGRGGNELLNFTVIAYDNSNNNQSIQYQVKIKNDLDVPIIEEFVLEGNKTALTGGGWEINGTITISVNARDPNPGSASNISFVEITFSTGGIPINSSNMTRVNDTWYEYQWNTRSYPENELITLKITVFDYVSRSTENTTIVRVRHQLPENTTTEPDTTISVITTTDINGSTIISTVSTGAVTSDNGGGGT